MSTKVTGLTAFGLWLLMLAAFALAGIVDGRGGGAFLDTADEGLLLMPIPLTFGSVGLFLALRRPGNRIGWVFLAAGALFATYVAAYMYFFWGVVQEWPGFALAGLASYVLYMPAMLALIALPLLLFPTGRIPSRSWRWLVWVLIAFVTLNTLFLGLSPQLPSDELGGRGPEAIPPEYIAVENEEAVVLVDNPIGIEALSDLEPTLLLPIFLVLLLASFIGPAVSMIYRFRRSFGVERLQIKWLALSASVAAAGLGSYYVVEELIPEASILQVLVGVGLLGVVGIPVAAGIAIVRYRLFEIDKLISRTFSYAIVILVLGLLFTIGSVWLPTQLLGEQSPLFVAGSTLGVAALFNPLRKAVMNWVDRRFYRSRYDAERVIDKFTADTRDATDAEQLAEDSITVITETMNPTLIGVWMRDRQTL